MTISKAIPIGTLALLAAFAAVPLVRAWEGKGMPEPGEVVRYERLGPFDRAVHAVEKEEGDGILDLLRGREASGDQSRKEAVNGAVCPLRIVPPRRPAPPWITLSAFAENGDPCHIEFRRNTDCETGKTSLSVNLPGGGRVDVPEDATGTLLALFETWEAADRKAFLAEPFPRRYVLGSNCHDGGTLSGVALLFYGNGTQWRTIWEANREAVPDPDRPKPGTELVIPALEIRKPDGIWEGTVTDLPERPLPQQYVLGTDYRDGGTLSGVARLFYGDGNKWPVIWEANKTAVPAPDRPKSRTLLVIPALPEGGAQ
jgi:hypothetical protein